jgi:hypothetical protein
MRERLSMHGYLGLVLCSLGWGLAACSSDSLGQPAAGVGGAGPRIILSTGSGGQTTIGDGGHGPSPSADANCGNSATTMTQVPADLLLVLDRSGSMTNSISDDTICDPGSGCSQRWATMVAAMRAVLASSPASIQWGLKLFSSPGITTGSGSTPAGCVVSPGVEVPLGTGNADTLVADIATTEPNFNTPTRAAIETALAYLKTANDGRSKYILLATDGEPNCAAAGPYATSPDLEATLATIAQAKAAGILVYVIGVGISSANLDEMARQGGTGSFYPARSPQSLTAALNSIVGIVASCVYTMSAVPPDPGNLGVYLDKQLVARSDADGWSLGGPDSVVFHGRACEGIKAGTYRSVQVLFGCPGTPGLPPVIP